MRARAWVVACGWSALFCIFGGRAVAQTPLDAPEGGPPYLGLYELGLYRNGSNECPESHRLEGLARANAITPLSSSGNPDPNGRIVFMSLGMSNTMIPFCNSDNSLPPDMSVNYPGLVDCLGWTFMGRLRTYPAQNPLVQMVNGAYLGQSAPNWVNDNQPSFNPLPPNPNIPSVVGNYDRIRDMILPSYTPAVTEASVQVAWMKVLDDLPPHGLPGPGADAEILLGRIGEALRYAKFRYPNLSIVFLSSGSWRGWGTNFNPEPQSYESGFSVKWVIDAQITQMESNNTIIDPIAGDLNYDNGTAPWIVWGPYLWSNTTSRGSDGMNWVLTDYAPDGVHHTQAGQSKYAVLLMNYFTQNRYSHCWFIGDAVCE